MQPRIAIETAQVFFADSDVKSQALEIFEAIKLFKERAEKTLNTDGKPLTSVEDPQWREKCLLAYCKEIDLYIHNITQRDFDEFQSAEHLVHLCRAAEKLLARNEEWQLV